MSELEEGTQLTLDYTKFRQACHRYPTEGNSQLLSNLCQPIRSITMIATPMGFAAAGLPLAVGRTIIHISYFKFYFKILRNLFLS